MAVLTAKYDNLESILVATIIGRTPEGELVGFWSENGAEIPMERADIANALRSLADGMDEQNKELNQLESTGISFD